ncbi:hypothetical protein RIF29_09878 [Crotalaria pallida]|uniref:Uncharacterized protein n=1 Tax=Crotalaria pallida TaxID=3830 RepID=A0AAN9FSC2_CROPI
MAPVMRRVYSPKRLGEPDMCNMQGTRGRNGFSLLMLDKNGSLRFLRNGFQKLDNIKDSNGQSHQLEELTGKMRECKRLIKEFDHEIKDEEGRNPQEVYKQLNDEKQSMVHEYPW